MEESSVWVSSGDEVSDMKQQLPFASGGHPVLALNPDGGLLQGAETVSPAANS